MHDFTGICAHGANLNVDGHLLKKQVDNLFVYSLVIKDARYTNVCAVLHNLGVYFKGSNLVLHDLSATYHRCGLI